MPDQPAIPSAKPTTGLETRGSQGGDPGGLRALVRIALGASVALSALMSTPVDGAAQLEVTLANDTEAERRTRAQLLRLVEEYDVEPWLYTTRVRIDETQIPHSHPVLTLHTRHLGDDHGLLSTFIHEQFHWLEEGETLADFRAAMTDFEEIYPEVPRSDAGGARDRESTYRHLLVCDLELQAMTRLVGEEAARDLLASITHYEWIYDRVLTDPRVREIAARHGFLLE